MASASPHSRDRPNFDGEDKIEKTLKEMGCLDLHYAVLDCFFETKDWRKCQKQVSEFKQCYQAGRAKLEAKK